MKLVITAFILSTTLAGVAFSQEGKKDSPTIQYFSPNIFWYTPIPEDAPLHENSAGFVQDFLRQKEIYFKTVNINTKMFASPVYIVGDDVPVQEVKFWDFQKKGYTPKGLVAQWKAVPVPAYAEAADGSDAEMTIYRPSTDTIWEFWKMEKRDGGWAAVWGGRLDNASKSDGVFPNRYGTTATSLPFMGGQLTIAELRAGRIDHAIGISLVEAEHFSTRSWPASRSDGWNPDKKPNRIPEGLRFRLDSSVDVDALNMHPIGAAVARAAQKYGFVVWDKAGAISLRAENPKAFTLAGKPDPYPELFDGTPAYAILKGFPWEKLQFLPMNYGKPQK